MTAPTRYLMVCTLRLGDILLTTPVLRSLKAHQPDALIDVLVLEGMKGILAGNPDIHEVLETPHRCTLIERIQEWRSLWRRYDIALTTVSSDRARLFCFIAGRHSIGFVNPHTSGLSARLLNQRLLFDDAHSHTVVLGLDLIRALKIPPLSQVVAPSEPFSLPNGLLPKRFAVIHAYPKFRYKMWGVEHWVSLSERLMSVGLAVVLTGGPDPLEKKQAQLIASRTGANDLSGQLSLGQTANLIKSSLLFVGPDTSVTHIAAATGVPTVALFGPSNPLKWGPWPNQACPGRSPWALKGSQRCGHVWIVQGEGDCVPCGAEGCERHTESSSRCLETLSLERVWETVRDVIANENHPKGD